MGNSWQDADSNAMSCGTLHLIKEASRPSAWVLNGGTATAFTDVDFSAYVPVGVNALQLKFEIAWVGDGAVDYSGWQLRQNGSSETAVLKTNLLIDQLTNLGAGITRAIYGSAGPVLCDSTGIIEYRFYNGDAAVGNLYLSIEGYYL